MTPERSPLNAAPIGVFDSGVGGLSVWREILRVLPHESTLYLADQAHVPYGGRSAQEVAALTHAAVSWLLEQGAKLIVIACNTASAAALTSLRQRWPDVPIVGMEPAIKPASQATKTGSVAVLATPGTLRAPRFSSLVKRFANGVQVYTLMGAGLVEMVERNELDGPAVEERLQQIMAPVQDIAIDHLVLGCTHFPFLSDAIQKVVGGNVTLVDPAPAVARQARRVLQNRQLQNKNAGPVSWRFVTTGDLPAFQSATERLIGDILASAENRLNFQAWTNNQLQFSGA